MYKQIHRQKECHHFTLLNLGAMASSSETSEALSVDKLSSDLLEVSNQLQSITNEAELLELVSHLTSLDLSTNNHLDNLIYHSRLSYERNAVNLDLSQTDLLTSLSSSSSLIKILSDSSYLSRKLTRKVKLLDYERTRVARTKEYVQNVIDLKSKITLIYESLPRKNWETVSKSISFILNEIPSEILKSSKFADIMIPTSEIPDPPATLLSQWTFELKRHYIQEFKKAVAAKDIVNLTNFFSYFPMIGEPATGISCYSDFINNIVAGQARQLMVGAPRDKLNFYSAAIMKLFEVVSKIVNQHSSVIFKYYDSDAMVAILQNIQREVDSQAGLIADTFWDARNFDKTVHDISSYSFPYLIEISSSKESVLLRSSSTPTNNSNSNLDETGLNIYEDPIEQLISVVDIGDYINEISTLLNRWSLYCRFIAIKYRQYSSESKKSDEEHLSLVPPLLESTFLSKVETKLVPCLDNLSNYYLKKSIEKSFKLEELPEIASQMSVFLKASDAGNLSSLEDIKPVESPPVSSVVEDIIIILNTLLTNALETGQPVHAKNVFTNVKKNLNNHFLKVLLNKLNAFQPPSGSNLLTAIESIKKSEASNLAVDMNDPNRNIITGNLSSLRNDLNSANAQQNVLSNMLKRGADALNSLSLNDEVNIVNFIIYINSVAVFKGYFNRIVTNLTNYNNNKVNKNSIMENNFKFGKDLEKLKDLVDGNLVSFINKTCDIIIKEYSQVFFNKVFKNRMRTIINEFFAGSNSYLIDSSSSGNSDVEMKKFLKNWLSLVKPYYRILSPEVFNSVNKLIILLIVDIIEKKIWLLNKKINLLGALKLEKDVSLIINEVTKDNYSLRENFIRITQIIMIMGFDDETEEEEMDWILTSNEKHKARHLRIDKN
ncbi:Golgi transport complex subunit [Saccharomycopsis crataegensis]|uniref:Conserved oligomeric Golgi complex subunit 4 n=1 Tax=Saccharomycopsis crataegensis TaxID=43959 RepID=A0AAV5QS85_9ASCO|nr:Golgi transport complex subunit [Saccharomycopsis crataegensis]